MKIVLKLAEALKVLLANLGEYPDSASWRNGQKSWKSGFPILLRQRKSRTSQEGN